MGNRRLTNDRLKAMFYERKTNCNLDKETYLANSSPVYLLNLLPVEIPEDISICLKELSTIEIKDERPSVQTENKFPTFKVSLPDELVLETYMPSINSNLHKEGNPKPNLTFMHQGYNFKGPGAIFVHSKLPLGANKKIVNSYGLKTLTELKTKINSRVNGAYINLKLSGTGYRGTVTKEQNKEFIKLRLGFSHEHTIEVPRNMKAQFSGPDALKLTGFDKAELNQYASSIRQLRPVNVYSGSGIYFEGDSVKRKVGKKKN